jgi:hypothetical protein
MIIDSKSYILISHMFEKSFIAFEEMLRTGQMGDLIAIR